jgi:hypothetical protein
MHASEQTERQVPFLMARPGRREGLWLAVLLALLACLPVLVVVRPQMTDYPSHLARYYIMLDAGRSAWLEQYYTFKWSWSGNLGVDLLIWPMARLFGLELAGKIVAALVPVLCGLAMAAVEWTLRRRIGLGTLLAFVTIWSPALLMGLLNFSLSLACALFAFAGWVRLEHWRWRWLLFLPVGVLVWLCHLAGWGVLGVLVLVYELHQRRSLTALITPWPLALPALDLLTGGGPPGMLWYGDNVANYKWAIWKMALRDQSKWFDVGTLLFLVLAILAAALLRRIDWRLGFAALAFALLSLALPRHLGGGDYTDYRLIAVALMTGCLAIDWAPPRLVLWLAPGLYALRLALTTTAWQASSREVEAMLPALDQLPQGARIAGAVLEETHVWAIDTLQHVPSYAAIRRDALVNTHFTEPGVHMLRLRQGPPSFKDPSQRLLIGPGKPIDLAAFTPARHADYLWYIGARAPTSMPPGAVVLSTTRTSFLARLAKPPPAR